MTAKTTTPRKPRTAKPSKPKPVFSTDSVPETYGDWWRAAQITIDMLVVTLDRYHDNEGLWSRSSIQRDLARANAAIRRHLRGSR